MDERFFKRLKSMSRIEFSDSEEKEITAWLNKKMDDYKISGEIDNLELDSNCFDVKAKFNQLRSDVVIQATEIETLLSLAPEHDEEYFIVPRVLE